MVPQRFRRFRACESETNTPKYGSVNIGGKTYKTVKIGKQEWLAENLDLETDLSYKNPSHPKYGRYYEWDALGEIQKALPSGWRVPDNLDWKQLTDYVGDANDTCIALKSKEFGGTDEYGFSVLPSGFRYRDGSFDDSGNYADFWSSSEFNRSSAYFWTFYGDEDYVYDDHNAKNYGFSVRCLRDSHETEEPNDEGHQSPRPRIRLIK